MFLPRIHILIFLLFLLFTNLYNSPYFNFQAIGENVEMKRTHEQNRRVLENILPAHVASHFLNSLPMSRADLYSEGRDNACIIFATITEFNKFYVELDGNNEGVECLRLLNEIIADFDEVSMG